MAGLGTPTEAVERAQGDVFLVGDEPRDIAKPGTGQTHQPTKVGLPEPTRGGLIPLLERRDPPGHRAPGVLSKPGPQFVLEHSLDSCNLLRQSNGKLVGHSDPTL